MLKINSLAADLAKEQDGDWEDVPEWPGVRLKVRSLNYKPYTNARDDALRKLAKRLNRAPYSSESEPIIARLSATFLLLGWEGIAGDDDAAMDYTPAKAMETLTDPSMRALVEQVISAAGRVGTRDVEFTVDAVKN